MCTDFQCQYVKTLKAKLWGSLGNWRSSGLRQLDISGPHAARTTYFERMLSLLEHFPVKTQPLQFLTECGNTGLTRYALSYPLVGLSTRVNSESIMTGRLRLAQYQFASSCPLRSNLPFLTQTNEKEFGGDRPLLVRLRI
jgi:hypothetical protein